MAEARKFQAIKGVRDILPPESALWNRVEQMAREVFETYGFGEIRLPIFEQTELFARSVGSETDIVSKEMYQFSSNPQFEDLRDARAQALRIFDSVARSSSQPLPGFFVASVREYVELIETKVNSGLLELNKEIEERLSSLKSVLSEAETEDEQKFWLDLRIKTELLKLSEDFALRPEATASVVRAYIEHGMHTLPGNVKLYYIGPMFRRERPQKGRYRQFYQIGAEVLGRADHPRIDAEVIEMLVRFFNSVGLTGTTRYINSIGCKQCRPKYVERLRAELVKVKDKLGADSQRRIETNPLRVLDSKLPNEQEMIATLPRIADHLCEDCKKHYAELRAQLALRGIAYEENWRLVRGLDYYMRTTFEIVAPGLGSQNAVCGGGRYDGLVELLGGPPTKGIGFAIGTDRLILSLQDRSLQDRALQEAASRDSAAAATSGSAALATTSLDVYVAWMGEKAYPTAMKTARMLREAGLRVELPASDAKLGKSLGLADKLGARHAVIIGENEVASGEFMVKVLADSEQRKVRDEELVGHLKGARNV